MKYHSTDTGFCRVYFEEGKRLLAYQENIRGQFSLMACTPSGEPSHEIQPVKVTLRDAVKADYEGFREWLERKDLICNG